MRVTGFESTPNPNALKCVVVVVDAVGGGRGSALRSYRSAAEAANDPLASALFAVGGVQNVLIAEGWITVGKRADTDWKSMKPRIKRAIEQHAEGTARGA